MDSSDRCPLCSGPNQCAIALDLPGTCWCYGATIKRDVLERVPVEAQGRICVCRACGTGDAAGGAATEDPSAARS